jgi:hypothetical protein
MSATVKTKIVPKILPRHICVCDGPDWGDARFIADWLSAVLAADSKIETYLVEHPKFRSRISRLEVESPIEFRPAAMFLLAEWLQPRGEAAYVWDISFHVDIEQDWCAELFAIMANIGFFELKGQHYKMSIPKSLEMTVVRKTLLRLARTEDSNYYLYPERLLHTMSWPDAERCKANLRRDKIAATKMDASDRAELLNEKLPIANGQEMAP